jgi:hypothetical protein
MAVRRRLAAGRTPQGTYMRKLGLLRINLVDLQAVIDLVNKHSTGVTVRVGGMFEIDRAEDLTQIPRRQRLPLEIESESPRINVFLHWIGTFVASPDQGDEVEDVVNRIAANLEQHRSWTPRLIGALLMLTASIAFAVYLLVAALLDGPDATTSQIVQVALSPFWLAAWTYISVAQLRKGGIALQVETASEREFRWLDYLVNFGWVVLGFVISQLYEWIQ